MSIIFTNLDLITPKEYNKIHNMILEYKKLIEDKFGDHLLIDVFYDKESFFNTNEENLLIKFEISKYNYFGTKSNYLSKFEVLINKTYAIVTNIDLNCITGGKKC